MEGGREGGMDGWMDGWMNELRSLLPDALKPTGKLHYGLKCIHIWTHIIKPQIETKNDNILKHIFFLSSRASCS
jgi:hypothetical protein